MTRPFVIIGSGGHAAVVAELLEALGAEIRGYIDHQAASTPSAIPWLGDDAAALALDPASVFMANGVGSVEPADLRCKITQKYEAAGFVFPALVHPEARVAANVVREDGCQVMRGAVVQTRSRLGRGVIVNTSSSIDHDANLGNFVHIAPGCVLSGGVRIDARAHVGTGAVVIQGIAIGEGALVGAGAVVVRDVRPGARVLGNPARES